MTGPLPMAAGLLAAGLWLWPGSAPAAEEVPGGDSVFADRGLAILWGVLPGSSEETTPVVIRIVPLVRHYVCYSVDAVDPFTGTRRRLAAGDLPGPVEVRSSRATYAEFPRREVHLYGSADDLRQDHPALTIFYLGIPDTTPEAPSEEALSAYFASALGKAKARGLGRSP